LQGLLGYLEQFYERTNPLGSLTKVYSKLEGELESAFEEGQVPGWEDRGGGKLPGDQGNAMDLQAFDTVDELESLGTPAAALLSLLGHMLRLYSCAGNHVASTYKKQAGDGALQPPTGPVGCRWLSETYVCICEGQQQPCDSRHMVALAVGKMLPDTAYRLQSFSCNNSHAACLRCRC